MAADNLGELGRSKVDLVFCGAVMESVREWVPLPEEAAT